MTVPVPEGSGEEHRLLSTDEPALAGQPTVSIATGLTMPSIGLGTYQLEGGGATDIVAGALELGYRHIDTAQSYGNERAVGAGIRASGIDRGEIFITTKVANDNHEPARLLSSVQDSLERLDTDHVDLLLIHWPVGWDTIAATLDTLAQVQAGGLTNHIGLSNFTIGQLDDIAALAPLEVLQVECHPYLQQAALRTWCVENDWIFTAYSPVAQGQVFGDERLERIAERHGTTPAAVALAWLGHQPNVVSIPRTSDRGHLADNWDARTLELTEAELDEIAELDAGRRLVDPDHAPW